MSGGIDRREFLHQSLAGAGLTLAFCLTGPAADAVWAANDKEAAKTCAPNAWVRIAPDNTVTVLVSRSEMGQGVFTSMAMIVAEELEADWSKIRVEASPATPEYVDPMFKLQLTGGSFSVRNMFDPLRKAGATAREMLVRAAAERWKVPPEECKARKSTVVHERSGKSATFGELCTAAAGLPVPDQPKLKADTELSLIGTPMPRIDIRDKVNGTTVFGMDITRPGMLYAVVERPPAYGAKLGAWEPSAAKKVPGVRRVFAIASGVAVCAESIHAALKGRAALEAKWEGGSDPRVDDGELQQVFMKALDRKGLIAEPRGDVEDALKSAAMRVSGIYSFPYLAHVPMEPINCTAHVQKERCDVWAPTQFQTLAVRMAAKEAGLSPEQVHVHTTYLGGGFGRRAEAAEVIEAVQISKEMESPVHLIWTREEDVMYDFFRPGGVVYAEAGLDSHGRVVGWQYRVVLSSIAERAMPMLMKDGVDLVAVEGLGDQDYRIANQRVEWIKMDLPIPVGFWRSVGHSCNAFAIESFVDELAHMAGKGPLQFRLDHLDPKSYASGVLQVAAEKAQWGKPLPEGRGRGIAQHFCYGSHVAYAVEASVRKEVGDIRVERVVCAVDCGPTVNPDTVKAQMEGAIIMALSVTLREQVHFAKGGVKSRNFDDYPLLSFSETPAIEVHIVKSDHPRGGVGEPGIPPLAPAVANAVFAATGVRLRNLPLSREMVKPALGPGSHRFMVSRGPSQRVVYSS